VFALFRERRDIALLLLGPIVLAIVAAIAHQYPFRGRLNFYLIPTLQLMVGAGGERIARAIGTRVPVLGGVAIAAFLAIPITTLVRALPPCEIEHTRRIRQPGDIIHVFPLTRSRWLRWRAIHVQVVDRG
jgi:hypothetical protein